MSKFSYKQILSWLQPKTQHYHLQNNHQNFKGNLCLSSNKISPKDIFLAIVGTKSNAHHYIKEANTRGALLFIVQKGEFSLKDIPDYASWIEVDNTALAWAYLEDAKLGFPSKKLKFLGVGGSNGKTSASWITHSLLKQEKINSCYIGTLGVSQNLTDFTPLDHTTPPPNIFFPLLNDLVTKGIQVVVMEVSSHALVQKRLGHLKFTGLAFTSFSQDHLDFHKTMEHYWNSKMSFFLQHSEPQGKIFVQEKLKNKFLHYNDLQNKTTYYPSWNQQVSKNDPFSTLNEISFTYSNQHISGKTPYYGNYNVENFFAALLLSSVVLNKIPDPINWEKLPQIPGRMHLVANYPQVIIDYAHTPDALDKILGETKKLAKKSQLWVIFGAGGDRDRSKRPLMTRAALKHADQIILTSDNPRSESPEQIISDLSKKFLQNKNIRKIVDREQAIKYCLENANKNDWVVIAGKGNEQYQQIGLHKTAFCDHNIVKKYKP
jgi:UDP-N-acetylmuramoyl-L-alanyl-D-glutamate--2,6-diaminopimelate ligase